MALKIPNIHSYKQVKRAITLLPAGALALGLFFSASAMADTSPIVVTETNTQGWAQNDTRTGGSTSFVIDDAAPLGNGALQLQTNDTNEAKADYFHAANIPLSQVNDLAYSTKQLGANSPSTDASFQLAVDVNGPDVTGGFTTLVYEPYWQNDKNPDTAPVVAGEWQSWDVDQGFFWSSRTVEGLTAGAGGPPFYTLADIRTNYPNAQLLGYGVNVGSYNPSTTINVDRVVFNEMTYDFDVSVDTSAPDVAITNPADGSSVQGTIDIRGTVTDENPDHYYLVVKNAAGQIVSGPHTVNSDQSFTDQSLFSWDTTQVVDGVYTIDLEARDQAGNKDAGSVATARVTVNNTVDDKDECKNGGWKAFGTMKFKNQGQCVSYANHNDGAGADDTTLRKKQ